MKSFACVVLRLTNSLVLPRPSWSPPFLQRPSPRSTRRCPTSQSRWRRGWARRGRCQWRLLLQCAHPRWRQARHRRSASWSQSRRLRKVVETPPVVELAEEVRQFSSVFHSPFLRTCLAIFAEICQIKLPKCWPVTGPIRHDTTGACKTKRNFCGGACSPLEGAHVIISMAMH